MGEGIDHARVCLPNGTIVDILDAIHSSKSAWDLLSFRTLWENGYNLMTSDQDGVEVLQLMKHGVGGRRDVSV